MFWGVTCPLLPLSSTLIYDMNTFLSTAMPLG